MEMEVSKINGYSIKDAKAIRYYHNVELMKTDTTLKPGMVVSTAGYYDINDGGSGNYLIRTKTESDIEDLGSIHFIGDLLVAELIIEKNILNVKQFGAYGDNEHDDLIPFQNAVNYINNKYLKLYVTKGKYYLSDKLIVPWTVPNYWKQDTYGMYEFYGDGSLSTTLRFNGKDGIHFKYNESSQSQIGGCIIHDFGVINEDFNINSYGGNELKPDDEKGIGILINHHGYISQVYNLYVKGFYIGYASRENYGGPLMSQLMALDCIFGFSSKNDTSNQMDSSSFYSCYQAGFISETSIWSLTNIIVEGSLTKAENLNDVQRNAFDGHGFVLLDGKYNMNGCYTEKVFGQSRYIENANVIDNNGAVSNNINYYILQNPNSSLTNWLLNNLETHFIECFYVHTSQGKNTSLIVNTNYYPITNSSESKNLARIQNDNYTDSYNTYDFNIVFNNVTTQQGYENTVSQFYKGNVKPIVKCLGSTLNGYQDTNVNKLPKKLYSPNLDIEIDNSDNQNIFNINKHKTFSDSSFNEQSIKADMWNNGTIVLSLVKKLNGVDVNTTTFMSISPDGSVSFPVNN